jgi:polyisoprenoid-binding protein YceI
MVTTEAQEQKAPTKRWSLDPDRTSVDFAVGTFWGLATVRGHFDRFAGTYETGPAGAKMELTIEADSIDTGNTDRDEHLRSYDFFDVVPNPHVHFTSTQVADEADGTLRITGSLEAAGKTVPVTLEATVQRDGDELELEGSTRVDQRAFGMSNGPLRMIRRPAAVHVKARLI